GQVADTSSNAVPAGAIGNLTIDIPDTSAPAASFVSTTIASAAPFIDLSVTFSDDVAMDADSLDAGDILVTGPNGYSATGTFIGSTPAGDGTPRTATYRITPPGGNWGAAHNGVY